LSFFQTRELIAEIELLEEEVANREQHVLSLYRTIFDNSASRPPSAQNSGKASPAHTKHGSRKHPSIISSAFCSSKKFPLQPLQALVCMDDRWKRFQKTSHTPLSNGKSSIDLEKTCFDPTKVLYVLIFFFVLQLYFERCLIFFFFFFPQLKSLIIFKKKKEIISL
jgi:hypothetical protein